jgi:hypothetical protein
MNSQNESHRERIEAFLKQALQIPAMGVISIASMSGEVRNDARCSKLRACGDTLIWLDS